MQASCSLQSELTTKVTVPSCLLPVMYVGEGETAGKVEGILHLFQNEEKGKSATSNVKYYFSTLLFTFLLHATINHRASILFLSLIHI